MTEAASEASQSTDRPEVIRHGMAIERIYTTPGVHPYDEVTWERRDVVQNNWKTGEVVFEQRGVEFPDFWSVISSTIVTTKYFRGAVGSDVREWSLRQLIDRVVLTYRRAGEEYGYFATPADAEIFEHELTYALLHQVFSFNSPVWFNVGTPAPQQVSACQPYHSLVSTPEGMIPIGRMVEENMVGHKVYDAQGLAEILAVKHNGTKEVLRLTTKTGHQLDVTSDHLVWRASSTDAGAFVPAGELAVGDQLSWVRTPQEGIEGADPLDIAEAALAGWLQADGFVGQYATGTNRSLTIEAMTVNDDEFAHVVGLVERVFPGAHYKVRDVESADPSLRLRRIRLYGEVLRPFVTKWNLSPRGIEMTVPEQLFDAPAPVAAAYIRSIFQAEGYVSRHGETTAHVGFAMISPGIVRGVQSLLARIGIFSRVRRNEDARSDRKPTFVLLINNEGDQELFTELVGFVCDRKREKLAAVLGRGGRRANEVKTLQIASIELLGQMPVYDIQTSSGEYLSSGNLRVHNCFILAVDDSMDSILNWYREEGMIFKGGSGAGLNLSRIRSSKELLSSGGTASGPVSFMRGADASAGTIKSGGATRRAAKMVVLDVDHPDIEEFIETKAREEDKIRALRDAGFDMDLGGKDISSVQYQNANNSVRVSDEFMRAVEERRDFGLRARADGSVIETVDAEGLFDKISKAAWECADPGIQYDDTINDWHTCPESGRINASNPCSEYMHLDNSSCNLASLNLMKFLREDDTFDAGTFAKVVELVITAMDISICFADFPTEAIGDTTRKYRQLGIGYANLGALLMASGLPYDSDAGRALAASITSLMTGTAYRRSAELAGVVGTYEGYPRNAEGHKRVMRKHAAANDAVRTHSALDKDVQALATDVWAQVIALGEQHGYRNSQASVLAPTGTIGLMMDCDTTGIEPDLALVKFKKMVGGGSLQIVNNTVPRALRKLGYTEETIEAIVEHIAQHGNVVDAPGLRPEHESIFDCAMGARTISPMGHVRMMAAAQPFLSGAISKTVNMPESATVDEIEEVYFQGWKLGLKALAIYRDNCKVGQPLSDAKGASKDNGERAAAGQATPETVIEYRPTRKRLPKNRPAMTTSFTVGGAEGYMTASKYPDDGLGEIFLKMSKQGSTLAGVMDAFSIAISIGLQYGVPLETYVKKFVNMRFDPAGMTDDPDVRMAQSMMDYIFRRLALDHLPYDSRSALGIYTAEERTRYVETGSYEPVGAIEPAAADVQAELDTLAQSAPVDPAPAAEASETPQVAAVTTAHSSTELLEALQGTASDAPMCFTCGTKMRPAGSCFVCEGCGATSGCS